MKKNKDLQFCLEKLNSLQNRDGFEPEQKRTLEVARRRLKKLRGKANPAKTEIYRAVRQIAEAILKALDND
jgi:BMFP domain-containing protein YqiC